MHNRKINLLEAWFHCRENATPFVVGTLVDRRGSTYRGIGARVLIDLNSNTTGLISGGCLESDIASYGRRVWESGKPFMYRYDGLERISDLFGFNTGCRGALSVLLESGRSAQCEFVFDLLSKIDSESIRSASLWHVFQNEGKDQVLSHKVSTHNSDLSFSPNFPSGLRESFIQLSVRGLPEQSNFLQEGSWRLAFETLRCPRKIAIFGAGQDSLPLIEFTLGLGWRPVVFDHRPAYLEALSLDVDRVGVEQFYQNSQKIIESLDAAVVMTHSFSTDTSIISCLLGKGIPYIGLLGPKHRGKEILKGLKKDGELDNFYFPVGLDLGGDSAEEIALSIIAEIQSVLNKKKGGNLRDLDGPIHFDRS